VRSNVKRYIVLTLMLLAAAFVSGQKQFSADAPKPLYLALNDLVGINLGMSRDALPGPTPDRELRCTSSDTQGRMRCQLLIHDELLIAGARVLSADFRLDKNRVTDIVFNLNTSHMGFMPLVFGLKKQFGKQFGTTSLPLLCWQNQVSSVIFFADDNSPAVFMSLTPACPKYDLPVSKEPGLRTAAGAAPETSPAR
jgi:hypothetical protein